MTLTSVGELLGGLDGDELVNLWRLLAVALCEGRADEAITPQRGFFAEPDQLEVLAAELLDRAASVAGWLSQSAAQLRLRTQELGSYVRRVELLNAGGRTLVEFELGDEAAAPQPTWA